MLELERESKKSSLFENRQIIWDDTMSIITKVKSAETFLVRLVQLILIPSTWIEYLSDKITLEALKFHLWSAADILRGSLDAQEYRQPVMTILFLKRLNDTFDESTY